MTIREIIQMTNEFPEDKTVPLRLKKEIEKFDGKEKQFLLRLVEGLIVTARNPNDIKIIREEKSK